MILAVDIGNSNTHLGVFQDRKLIVRQTVPDSSFNRVFLAKISHIKAGRKIISAVRQIIYSSTRPDVEPIIVKWAEQVFKITPLKAGRDFPIPIVNQTARPAQVGTDRLIGAVAARAANPPRKSYALVIDSGTAVTFNVVSPKGEFLGGVIAPGYQTIAKSLPQNCALLPLVPAPAKKPPAIGRNTQSAISAGVYYGFTGLVKNIAYELIMKYKNPHIIITGGDAPLIKSAIRFKCRVIPDLTLKGLLLSYLESELNRKGS